MDQFSPGEVVMLKSGGPKMTVVANHLNDWTECVWIDSTAVNRVQFKNVCLVKIEEEKDEREKRVAGRPRG